MSARHILLISLVIVTPALAQSSGDRSHQPLQPGLRGRMMDSCRADLQKFCGAVNLKQECLVAHWTRIASDCQDALATPMRGGGD